jgi:dipeptidyl aminopeptidase/acylaminoacyl peptidase
MIRTPGGLLIALAACIAYAQAPPPHTVEELLREPVVRDVSLSPDGKRLAIAGKFGSDRDLIAVADIDRFHEPDAVRKFSIGKEGWHSPLWVLWANDRRLLVGLQVGVDAYFLVAGRQVEAIDADGGNPVALFADAPVGARYGLDLSRVVDITPDDPDHVVMAAWNRDTNDLFKVNVNTGVATHLIRGRSNTIGWETEGGRPALRYDVNRRGTELSVYGRDVEDPEEWARIVKLRLEDVAREWEYAGDAPGIGKIFVRARRDGADTQNIYEYDLRTKSAGDIVAQAPGFDMSRAFAINGEYAGATYVADTTTYLLKDPMLQGHWNGMRRYFKDQANVRIVEIDRNRTRMLLYVAGPQSPGDYYFYDIATKNLTFIASDRPWLEPQRLAPVEVLKSPMRDGTAITSYLTRPNGANGALPLVVMPHGGPEMRDSIDYDPLAQSFAAQGWLVLQPNFRGSSGYGERFAQAGYRQWAKRMQDDVTDAVNDLVKRGVADPERIAIYGASYGGYAALMGAVVTPGLYQAAVSLAGVSDLREFVAYVRKEDGDDAETYRYWVESIGDPKTEREAIDALSPRYRAAEINIPVLLMHGTEDGIVPEKQSELMQKALEKAGKSVRYLPFPGEPHSRWSTANEIRQIDEAIAFLKPLLQP